ncbi:hypothetical protein G7Y89_g9516 [Cudoniella acicularis]|uniref:DUF7907 domain-containing protein n=1 Tax=Cudoniella acicularis TaxID=354080 RepID=A0A8H4RH63_9HELO|nr:hypothetical protein G7Y89_g9516 [Cudoniella acicularis]
MAPASPPATKGAAIEGLCVGGPVNTYSGQYYFNTSSVPDVNTTGLLTWELHGGNFNLSSPMDFSYNPASNVAVPLFTPSETGTNVAFDERNRMNLQQYLDDTKPLPNYAVKPLYRWYVCTTYAGYLYQTLAWVMGDGKPENPTCQKVDVVRVFI